MGVDFFPVIVPGVAELCIEMQTSPGELCITFPGGGQLCAQAGFEMGDLSGIAQSLMAPLNAVLMPLIPIFTVFEVIKLLFDAIKAVPALIGPPPDPSKLLKIIPEIGKVVDKIVSMLPMMSVPLLVRGIIDVLITALLGIKIDLKAMISALGRVAAAQAKAENLGNVEFSAALECASGNLDIQFANKNASLAPLNRLLGVINFFMDLAQLGCIPAVPSFDHLGDGALKILDNVIALLQKIRDAISIPGAGIGAMSASPCE